MEQSHARDGIILEEISRAHVISVDSYNFNVTQFGSNLYHSRSTFVDLFVFLWYNIVIEGIKTMPKLVIILDRCVRSGKDSISCPYSGSARTPGSGYAEDYFCKLVPDKDSPHGCKTTSGYV